VSEDKFVWQPGNLIRVRKKLDDKDEKHTDQLKE